MAVKSTPESLTVPGTAPLPRNRRRRIVVDPPYQVRAGLLVGSLALVLLALLNTLVLTRSRAGAVAGAATAWTREAGSDIGLPWLVLLAGSAVVLGGVVLIGILESHRTAGASFAIRRSIEAIRAGRSGERVRLRKHDHLQDLAEAVNRLAESIEAERAARE